MKNLKKQIRRNLILKRKNLDKIFVMEKSKVIQTKLFSLGEYIQVDTIMFYISYDNEVYTHSMIQDSIKKGKTIVVPKVDDKDITPSMLTSWSELSIGSYNILEPKQIKYIPQDEIDMIIVPGVGFDLQGYRIGHGKGYYDRFLRTSTILKIGLAFEFQVLQKIPHEKHDIKVDKIITEERIIECLGNNFF